MKLFILSALSLFLAGTTSAIPTFVRRDIASLPNGSQCGDTSFNDFQIEDAAQRGINNRNGPYPGSYPKPFDNDEGFTFGNCPDGQLYEFPILESGQVYGGGRPYEFRVIYQLTTDGNGKYCGLVYHSTSDTGFDHCQDQ